MNGNLTELAARLAELNAHLASWQESSDQEFSKEFDVFAIDPRELDEKLEEAGQSVESKIGKGPLEEAHALFDKLCDLYIETTPAQRSEIRKLLGDHPAALQELPSYRWRAIRAFESTKDPKWIDRALASVSIEDLRIDYRDTLVDMGEVFIQAHNAGLDPGSLFRQFSTISSSHDTFHIGSTHDFFANFQNGSYFKGSVAPKLRKK